MQVQQTADGPTDVVLDAVADVLEANRGTWFTPSQVARKAKVPTYQAHRALVWLEDHSQATGDGNGAWRKWRAREWGEGVPR